MGYSTNSQSVSSESRILRIACALFQCICVFACVFFMGMCNRDQEKVNYLLVLRCRLASPGWAGSSGEREVKVEKEREEEEKGNPRLAQNNRSNLYNTRSGTRTTEK